MPTITDHTDEASCVPCSRSSRTSIDRSPVRKAMSTVWTATGIKSKTLVEVLTAAAASEPVHRPRTVVSTDVGYGFEPSPWNLRTSKQDYHACYLCFAHLMKRASCVKQSRDNSRAGLFPESSLLARRSMMDENRGNSPCRETGSRDISVRIAK